MNIENIGLNTKALPEFDWGQRWIRSDGSLSVVVVVHEPFDDPQYLHKAFPNSLLISNDATRVVNEREIAREIRGRIHAFKSLNPDNQYVITACHAFIFNLIHELDFRLTCFTFTTKKRDIVDYHIVHKDS